MGVQNLGKCRGVDLDGARPSRARVFEEEITRVRGPLEPFFLVPARKYLVRMAEDLDLLPHSRVAQHVTHVPEEDRVGKISGFHGS